MRLVSFVAVLCILCSLLGFHSSVSDIESNNSDHINGSGCSFDYSFNADATLNYHKEENNIVIYGNYTDFDSSLLHSLTHNKDKICIFYDLNLADNVNKSYEILQNNVVIYYYESYVPHVHSYKSSSTEVGELIDDINYYVNERLAEINGKGNYTDVPTAASCYNAYSSSDKPIEEVRGGSFREEKKPYGYVDCNYSVKKYGEKDESSIYVVEADFYFTPGTIARYLGDTGYNNWFINSGYIKIKASKASDEGKTDQLSHGNGPVFKDAYPLTTRIYSRDYRSTELVISAQKDSKDAEKYTWLFTCSVPKNEANHLSVEYVFEMSNGQDLFEDDIRLTFEYGMTVCNNNWWELFNKDHTFSGCVLRSCD